MPNTRSTSLQLHASQSPDETPAVVDQTVVDVTIAELRVLHLTAAVALARACAELLVRRVFDGDVDRALRVGRRDPNLAAVLADARLPMPPTRLWYALHLLPQLQLFGRELSDALPMSHHRLLIHVRDESARVHLAHEGCHLSKRELEERIRAWRPGGRRPRPRRAASAPTATAPPAVLTFAPPVQDADEAAMLTLLAEIERVGRAAARAVGRIADAPPVDPELLRDAVRRADAAVNDIDLYIGTVREDCLERGGVRDDASIEQTDDRSRAVRK